MFVWDETFFSKPVDLVEVQYLWLGISNSYQLSCTRAQEVCVQIIRTLLPLNMSGVTAHPAQPGESLDLVIESRWGKEERSGLHYTYQCFAFSFYSSLTYFALLSRLELGLKDKSNSTKSTQQQHSTKRKRFLIERNLILPALVRIGFCYFQVVRQNTFSQTNPRRRRVQPPQTREYHLLPALKTIPPKKNSILKQTLKRRRLFLLSRKANHLK